MLVLERQDRERIVFSLNGETIATIIVKKTTRQHVVFLVDAIAAVVVDRGEVHQAKRAIQPASLRKVMAALKK